MSASSAEIVPGLDEEPVSEPAAVRRGRRLGRYVLCYELAAGGMATVYLGRAEGTGGFDRLVALKVIHPHLAKEKDFVEMFLDEARLAARVVHPNVCSVFDYGSEDGTYFLAMDYLVGENAGRVMRAAGKRRDVAARPELPLLFARIIADACEGLHAAHEARADDGTPLGLVHRDVTPHNLFVGYDGSVRVVDFGVAKASSSTHRTTAGTLKGKFPYMSPEQVQQQPLDRRSDVWSLGVCLHEMLTRRRLFTAEGEFQTLRAVLEREVPVPSSLEPNVPAALDAVVMKALQRDPALRYGSAREMGRALSSAIATSGGAGAADLAELMESLFEDVRAERNALLEQARRVDPEQPSTSAVGPAPRRLTNVDSQSSSVVVPITTDGPPTPAWRTPAVLGALGLCAVLGAGIGGWASFGGPASPARSASGAPTSTPTPAPAPAHTQASTQTPPAPAAVVEPTPAPVEPPSPPDSPVEPAAATPPETPRPSAPEERRGAGGRRGAAPREQTARVEGNGTLNVVTPPGWADIFVDGARAGRSPTELRLTAGRHAVRLLPYGEEPAITRSVDVEPDSVGRLVVRLEP